MQTHGILIRIIGLLFIWLCAQRTATAQTDWRIYSYGQDYQQLEQLGNHLLIRQEYRLIDVNLDTWQIEGQLSQWTDGVKASELQSITNSETIDALVMAYTDGSIALRHSDGSQVWINDISNSAVQGYSKTPIALYECDGQLYITTSYGVIWIDLTQRVVRDTWTPITEVQKAFAVGSQQYRIMPQGLFRAHESDNTHFRQSWRPMSTSIVDAVGSITEEGELVGIGLADNGSLWMFDTLGQSLPIDLPYRYKHIKSCKGGVAAWNEEGQLSWLHFDSKNNIRPFHAEGLGKIQDLIGTPSFFYILHPTQGVCRYHYTSEGTKLRLQQEGMPLNIPSTQPSEICCCLSLTPEGKLLVLNSGLSAEHKFSYHYARRLNLAVLNPNDESWHNITQHTITNTLPEPGYISGPLTVRAHLTLPERYYVGSLETGVYVIDHDTLLERWDHTNSGVLTYVENDWADRVDALLPMPEGDIWMVCNYTEPYQLVRRDTKGCWQYYDTKLFTKAGPVASLVHHEEDGKHYLVFGSFMSYQKCRTAVYCYGKDAADTSDDQTESWNTFVDQNGRTFIPSYLQGNDIDRHGRVWQKTRQGAFYYPNCASMLLHPGHVVWPMVADINTGQPSLLFKDISVRRIIEDKHGTIWFATANYGLMRYDEKITQCLAHIATDNSPLPSNEILDMVYDSIADCLWISSPGYIVRHQITPIYEDVSSGSDVICYPSRLSVSNTNESIQVLGLRDQTTWALYNENEYGGVLQKGVVIGGSATCNLEGYDRGIYRLIGTPVNGQNGIVARIVIE